MRKVLLFIAVLAGFAAFAVDVDQGRPGRQGGWKVDPGPCRLVAPDGGTPYAQTLVTADAGMVPSPPRVGSYSPPRSYMVVCNTPQNTAGNLKCRSDGVVPVFALGNVGDYLASGNCIKYPEANLTDGGSPVFCISDQAAGVYAATYECW